MARAISARSKAVYTRTGFGQFARECDAAADRTAMRVAKEGAKVSRALAPVGEKRDRRPGHTPLKRSIGSRMIGKAKAEWYSTSKHALHVEFGTSPHQIVGKMNFEWTNAGTFFYWNNPRYLYWNWDPAMGAIVYHPGADAQPFLLPAYEIVARRKAMKIAKQEFPG